MLSSFLGMLAYMIVNFHDCYHYFTPLFWVMCHSHMVIWLLTTKKEFYFALLYWSQCVDNASLIFFHSGQLKSQPDYLKEISWFLFCLIHLIHLLLGGTTYLKCNILRIYIRIKICREFTSLIIFHNFSL